MAPQDTVAHSTLGPSIPQPARPHAPQADPALARAVRALLQRHRIQERLSRQAAGIPQANSRRGSP